MSQAIDIMVHHVENLKRTYEKDHSELQEARSVDKYFNSSIKSKLDLLQNCLNFIFV